MSYLFSERNENWWELSYELKVIGIVIFYEDMIVWLL